MITCNNCLKQAVIESLSTPGRKRAVKKSKVEVVPPNHCSGISPLRCNVLALLQVEEGLGFPCGLFETATQFSQERESLCPKGPAVSMATGVKMWCWLRAAYFSCLFRSARAATAPASLVALGRWEGANVSGQVASHTRSLPLFQSTSVTPSGRLPLLYFSQTVFCSNRHILLKLFLFH